MSKRNRKRIRNILARDHLTAERIALEIPAGERPGTHSIAAWLRSQGCPRALNRGGGNRPPTVWGPLK